MNEVIDKDACELLDADHLATKHLFVEYARLAMSGQDDAGARGALALRACSDLTVHATIEEEIFYPALRRAAKDAAPLLDEAEAEHQEVKEFVARIEAEGSVSEVMDDLVAQLASAVEHHVKEERDNLFPKAKAAPGLDLVALGQQLRDRQQQLMAQMKKRPAGR